MQALMPPSGYSVVIVRPEHVASAKSRIGDAQRVLVVSEAELLQVQSAFLRRRPDVLVMHADLAGTSRGAAMISALKAAGMDGGAAIRVFIEDDGQTPMLIVTEANLPPEDIVLETSRPLDRVGTRQTPRFPMHRRTIAVNGEAAQLVDLSISGAQVQARMRLHPLKVARLVVPGDSGDLRMQGTIAWATGVLAAGTIQYRAGIEFVKPDKQLLAAFCEKHGDAPDPLLGGLEHRQA
jgi:hypothetical protein